MSKYFEDGPAPQYGPNLIAELKKKCPYIFLVCFRDKNQNVVVYQARVENGKLLHPPIEAYWLILEPSYQKARLSKRITHDREELNWMDHKFAWGFEQSRISDTEAKFEFKNFPHAMTVKLQSDSAQLCAAKNNRKYLIRSLYVAASEDIHIFNLQNNVKELYLVGVDITEKPYKPAKVYLKQ